jgi:hypothetical protein
MTILPYKEHLQLEILLLQLPLFLLQFLHIFRSSQQGNYWYKTGTVYTWCL